MRTLLSPAAWLAHAAVVLSIALSGGLGLWQYDAWAQHRDLEARNISEAPAVPLADLMDGDSVFPGDGVGRPVRFAGEWLTANTMNVADRRLAGRDGYWVVTPVLIEQPDGAPPSAMPVVRGWSATTDTTSPVGTVEITGWLQPTEGSGPVDPDPYDDIIPTMRIASLVQHIEHDLYSGFVVARTTSDDAQAGLEPVTPAAIPTVSRYTGARNLFYAFEWWFFGAFAVFLWGRWCRDELTAERNATRVTDEPDLAEPTPTV